MYLSDIRVLSREVPQGSILEPNFSYLHEQSAFSHPVHKIKSREQLVYFWDFHLEHVCQRLCSICLSLSHLSRVCSLRDLIKQNKGESRYSIRLLVLIESAMVTDMIRIGAISNADPKSNVLDRSAIGISSILQNNMQEYHTGKLNPNDITVQNQEHYTTHVSCTKEGGRLTSKHSNDVKFAGMNHTMGLVSRKGTKASEDSMVVARVKAGGGILLAVTNIPEFIWQESRNNVYGQTNNPYDFHRTAGASSGGCHPQKLLVCPCGPSPKGIIRSVIGLMCALLSPAAAVAACLVPMAVGSDTGGSIRMPCYFCGLFGHMPTTGLISTKGIYFRTGEETDPTMSTAGTLTRYAEDISPILKLLVGENVDKLKLDTQVDMKQLRLSFVDDLNEMRMSRLNGETRNVLEKAVSYLEERCGTKANKVRFKAVEA
ncbi:hypothetical protein J6590_028254 [Homalodisca vitripennis]|nr:hypothetical protein J6590_028254 [Homalodisca vitripennis]